MAVRLDFLASWFKIDEKVNHGFRLIIACNYYLAPLIVSILDCIDSVALGRDLFDLENFLVLEMSRAVDIGENAIL